MPTTPEQAQRILDNTFYRNVSGALGGTQEYMAMEKLHELHDEGNFDLIVVDTPPTRHALDFLDAPKRLTRLLDNRVFRLLMMPTRAYLKVASVAVQTFLRTVARVVGSEVIEDVVAFFRAFEGMEEGFRTRAQVVGALLDRSVDGVRARQLAPPRRDAGGDVLRGAVGGSGPDRAGADREPRASRRSATKPRRACGPQRWRSAPSPTRRRPRRLAAPSTTTSPTSGGSQPSNGTTSRRCGPGSAPETALAYVPYLAHDVHDFATLREVGALLFDTISAR